jgi:hypothetical protein
VYLGCGTGTQKNEIDHDNLERLRRARDKRDTLERGEKKRSHFEEIERIKSKKERLDDE